MQREEIRGGDSRKLNVSRAQYTAAVSRPISTKIERNRSHSSSSNGSRKTKKATLRPKAGSFRANGTP